MLLDASDEAVPAHIKNQEVLVGWVRVPVQHCHGIDLVLGGGELQVVALNELILDHGA